MEKIAQSYLQRGDLVSAQKMYASLEATQPKRMRDMLRFCRVLLEPNSVPVPHRHADIAEALLEPTIPLEGYFGVPDTTEETLRRFNRMLLLVHPDKNPHPKAAEAFVRLKEMKETALEAVAARKLERETIAQTAAAYEKFVESTPVCEPTPPQRPQASVHKKKRASFQREGKNNNSVRRTELPISELRSKSDQLNSSVHSLSRGRSSSFLESSLNASSPLSATRLTPQAVSLEPQLSQQPHRHHLPEISLKGPFFGKTERTPPASPTALGDPASPRSVAAANLISSSLHKHKQTQFKLSCSFQHPVSVDAQLEAILKAQQQQQARPPSCSEDDDDDEGAKREDVPDDEDDEEEETLNCTVTSMISRRDSDEALASSTTTTTTFTLSRSKYPELMNGDPKKRSTSTRDVEQAVLSSAFTATALASTQAVWKEYRSRRLTSDGSENI